MSDYLPPIIVANILARLPTKTLLRYTTVSKLWYSLITSPYFVTLHTNTSIANSGSRFLVRFCTQERRTEVEGVRVTEVIGNEVFDMIRYDYSPIKRVHYIVYLDNHTFDKSTELDFPFNSSDICFKIIGVVNGLVCVSDDDGGTVILWNPSLRKSVTFPKSNINNNLNGQYDFSNGFGCVPETIDYKVVRVRCFEIKRNKSVQLEVEIYELHTGFWRTKIVEDFLAVIKPRAPQGFLKGAIHWIGYYRDKVNGIANVCIVSLDMKTEKFDVIKVPYILRREWVIFLGTFGEMMSLIHHIDNCCCIWVMKEYKEVESWTKLFTINQIQESLWMPFHFRQNGDILLMKNFATYHSNIGKLSTYDPQKRQNKNLQISGLADSFYVASYVDSLVLLKGSNEVFCGMEIRSNEFLP